MSCPRANCFLRARTATKPRKSRRTFPAGSFADSTRRPRIDSWPSETSTSPTSKRSNCGSSCTQPLSTAESYGLQTAGTVVEDSKRGSLSGDVSRRFPWACTPQHKTTALAIHRVNLYPGKQGQRKDQQRKSRYVSCEVEERAKPQQQQPDGKSILRPYRLLVQVRYRKAQNLARRWPHRPRELCLFSADALEGLSEGCNFAP